MHRRKPDHLSPFRCEHVTLKRLNISLKHRLRCSPHTISYSWIISDQTQCIVADPSVFPPSLVYRPYCHDIQSMKTEYLRYLYTKRITIESETIWKVLFPSGMSCTLNLMQKPRRRIVTQASQKFHRLIQTASHKEKIHTCWLASTRLIRSEVSKDSPPTYFYHREHQFPATDTSTLGDSRFLSSQMVTRGLIQFKNQFALSSRNQTKSKEMLESQNALKQHLDTSIRSCDLFSFF